MLLPPGASIVMRFLRTSKLSGGNSVVSTFFPNLFAFSLLQLDEAEHATSTARVAFQEQFSKLEHSLNCSEQESNVLRQQV